MNNCIIYLMTEEVAKDMREASRILQKRLQTTKTINFRNKLFQLLFDLTHEIGNFVAQIERFCNRNCIHRNT